VLYAQITVVAIIISNIRVSVYRMYVYVLHEMLVCIVCPECEGCIMGITRMV